MKFKLIINYVFFFFIFFGIALIFFLISLSVNQESSNISVLGEKKQTSTIIIDAGHGGEDGGTVGRNGVLEKKLNLEISLILKDILCAKGYDVILTRSEDALLYDKNADYEGKKKALDLAARVKIAEEQENCIFISIHMNSFPSEIYSGLQVYYSENDPRSSLLANEIQTLVRNELQNNNNRKIKAAGQSIFVLDRISSPAVLIECGFLSSPEECALLSSKDYQKKLSYIISEAIEKYISYTLENENKIVYN